VLLLRELVLAAHAAGELVEEHGVWRWTGRLELAPSLSEVIDARIGGLDPHVRTAVEYVAFGEPIGLSLLGSAGVAEALERAEERQLVRVLPDGRRCTVRLAHPLYGEVARQRCPATRAQRVLAELAGLVERAGARRGDDVLRVATWRLDSGTARAPELLLKACRQAFAAYDLPLALRLGHAALGAGGGFEAADSVAILLMFADQPAAALRVLAESEPLAADDSQRARWHVAWGISTYWGTGDEAAAEAMPGAAMSVSDPAERIRILAHEAMMRLHHNEPDRLAALDAVVTACPDARPGDRALVRSAVAHMRAARGEPVRTVREMAAVEADAAQWRAETPYFQLAVEVARGTAMILAADLAAVDAVIAAEYAGMVDAGDFYMGSGYLTVVRAQAARLRGQLGEAVRHARIGRARLIAGRVFSGFACAELAHAAAQAGDAGTAATAMAEADQVHRPTMAILYPYLETARAWTAAAAGDRMGAREVLRGLARRLRADSFRGYEVFALHDLLRLGEPAATLADRLGELAGEVEGAFPALAHRHAVAAAPADADALLAVAADLAGLGLNLHAAEVATAAVRVGRDSRSGTVSVAASRRADYLAACENGNTPGVALVAPALTGRERQIARRAADGASSKQIADELFLSRRTVDNHLFRVYAKLGVNGRTDLAVALRTLGNGS
jgi:DNA-binding CsgD family transcriptional regulator